MSRPNAIKSQKLIMDRIVIRPKTRCWIWTNNLDKAGYGEIRIAKQLYRAHRISYEVFNGPIPDGLHVLHLVCDNPACVNPEHLGVGTDKDNSDDKISKNRDKNRGEESVHSRLKNNDIFEIREKYATGNYTQQELGDEYGVRADHISRIVNNIRWSHLGGVS